MAVTFRAAGAKSTDGTSPFSQVVAFPAGLVADDIVILVLATEDTGTASISAVGSIATWTAITGSPVSVSGGKKLYVWWGRYSSGATGPTVDATTNMLIAATAAWSGCDTTSSVINIQETGNESTSDTSLSFATTVSTTVANCMVLLISTDDTDSNTAQHGSQANSNLGSIAERLDVNTNAGTPGGGIQITEGTLATAGAIGTWTTTLATASAKAYLTLALQPPQNTTQDKTQTGVSRIQKVVDVTQAGVSRITATTDKTQSGVSRIQKTVDVTQQGVSRIQKIVDVTQSGLSRITATVDKTQSGVADIRKTTDRTQSGVANIGTPSVDKTITGVSRIQKSVDSTQTGRSRIQKIVDQTLTGAAKVIVIWDKTQTGVSRITALVDKTITGRSRINAVGTQTLAGTTNIEKSLLAKLTSLDVGSGLGKSVAFTGNTLPIDDLINAPSGTPPGGKGITFRIVGGVAKMYIWDGSNWISS